MEGGARLAISDKKRNRNSQMKVEGCEYRLGRGGWAHVNNHMRSQMAFQLLTGHRLDFNQMMLEGFVIMLSVIWTVESRAFDGGCAGVCVFVCVTSCRARCVARCRQWRRTSGR